MRSLGVLVLILVSCGGSHPEPAAPPSNASPTPAPAAAPRPALAGDPTRGKALYEKYCMACHTVDGSTRFGPSWRGIWGKTIALADGRTATVDATFVRRSIVEPLADQTAGFPPIMPSFQGALDDGQIDDLVAFIASLH
ncbi:MAG TPA: cytochrome c [Kofleriaceae bacterium]|nr:cytochrome c [Kofleriaceae bacterium]